MTSSGCRRRSTSLSRSEPLEQASARMILENLSIADVADHDLSQSDSLIDRLAGLRSGGFSEPANVTLIPQITNGDPALLSPMAAELVARKVDLIFAVSSVALQAARDATTTIPIVSLDLETDPIGSGFVKSSAQPGGNITGVFFDFPDFGKKWLEVLKETLPQKL